jgi:hypothetical protein
MTLKILVSTAKRVFQQIQTDLPELRSVTYLVFSSSKGQGPLTDDAFELFCEFKELWLPHLPFPEEEDVSHVKKEDETKRARIVAEIHKLTIDPEASVEFRFLQLDYRILAALKQHPLVRQPKDMLSTAWIRVILFRLGDLDQVIRELEKTSASSLT